MATKKELEDENRVLKAEYRKLVKNEKEFVSDAGDLHNLAYDVTMNGKEFEVVIIKYDKESKKATVSEVKNLGLSFAKALMESKKLLVDRLLYAKKNKEKR